MSKIKILVNHTESFGVGFYRVIKPFTILAETYPDDFEVEISNEINFNDWNYLKNFNIIFSHRTIVNFEDMEIFCKECRKHDIKTIIDLDDYFSVPDWHPLYESIKNDNMEAKIINNLKHVDYVTTTTPIFAKYISEYNKNVFVFENGIDDTESEFKLKPKEQSEFTRFLFLGGSSHRNDLELLRDSFDVLRNDDQVQGKYQLHIAGFDLRGTTTSFDINRDFIVDLQKFGINFGINHYKSLVENNSDLSKLPWIPKQILEKYGTTEIVTKNTRAITPKESIWYEYEKIFTSDYKLIKDKKYVDFLGEFELDKKYPNELKEQPYIRHKTQGVYKFANNYRHADIALAPIFTKGFCNGKDFVDNQSNRYQFSKSNLKLIESGFHKLPVIASEVPIYTFDNEWVDEKNVLFVKSERQYKDWGKKIKKCIMNPNLVKDMGEAAHELVKRKYHIKVINKKRKEFFQSIIK